jgi:hypothetical protein
MIGLLTSQFARLANIQTKFKSGFTKKVVASLFILLCLAIIFFIPIADHQPVSSKNSGGNTSTKSSLSNNSSDARYSNKSTANVQASNGESGPISASSGTTSKTTAKSGNILYALPSQISSGKLVFSTSTYTIGTATQPNSPVSFSITASTGVKILTPTATANSAVVFESPFSPPSLSGFQSQYDANFIRAYPSAQGQVEATISAKGADGITYSGQILVIYPPQPYLTVNQGNLTCSNNGSSTTYSATYTLVPNGNIGAPTLRMSLGSDVGYIGGSFNVVTQYTGQNNFTLTAIISNSELNSLSISGTTGFYFTVTVAADDIAGGGWMHYWANVPC